MSFWAEVFLGVIAVATLTMAAIQVGIIVYGLTVARRVDRMLTRMEADIKPLADNLNAIARDAAHISSLAVGQADRVDRLLTDVTLRVEQTAMAVQETVLKPLRDGAAALAGVKAAIDIFRELTKRPGAARTRSDEEDSLFIG